MRAQPKSFDEFFLVFRAQVFEFSESNTCLIRETAICTVRYRISKQTSARQTARRVAALVILELGEY